VEPTVAVEPIVTVNDAVVHALDIGPDSSAAERTIDITTVGRRSGAARRIEVWFHHIDGRWYLSGVPGPRNWYANLRADPRFVVHPKHGVTADLPATARPADARTSMLGSRAARWSRSCSPTSSCGRSGNAAAH
jgi:hypothetical protein